MEQQYPTQSKVFILLATYNGEKYLNEQIQSIRRQTFSSWKLIIRDDGSQDKTNDIIKKYTKLDSRIIQLSDNRGNLGVVQNFSVLMDYALDNNAQYIFFCDQDDVWKTNKIRQQLSSMLELEALHGTNTPLLTYCDMEVVDSTLKLIHPSIHGIYRIKHIESFPLNLLLCQNLVTGCGCLINRCLLKKATPIPYDILIHDWWLAVVVAAIGKAHFDPTPLLFYRQHENNQIGARKITFLDRIIRPFSFVRNWEKVRRHGLFQAKAILNITHNHPSNTLIESYAQLDASNFIRKLYLFGKFKYHKQGILRTLTFIFINLISPFSKKWST